MSACLIGLRLDLKVKEDVLADMSSVFSMFHGSMTACSLDHEGTSALLS